MFTGLFLNLINIPKNFLIKFLFHFLFIIILYLSSLSQSASISTLNNLSLLSNTNQYQFISNNSYRNFLLRQYFIDLLNISHTSLVRSMIYNHHLNTKSIEYSRQKRFIDDTSIYSPLFTLQSSNCLMIDNQVQSTFIWSHSINTLSSVELIYHIDSIETKEYLIPLIIKFKYSKTLIEFLTINTYLQFDVNRDFYFINIYEYINKIKNQSLIIETIINNNTCQTSHTYMIISALRNNYQVKQTQTDSICKIKTIQIKFQDLGLAYLIIRPKEYTFTYCDGSCSYSTYQSQPSMHAVFQSIINKKNPNIPQPTCAPTLFADDNFLLRQIDGSMAIYPIKDVIVKQCTCL